MSQAYLGIQEASRGPCPKLSPHFYLPHQLALPVALLVSAGSTCKGLRLAPGVTLSFPFLTLQSSTVAPLSGQFQPPVYPLYLVPSGLNAITITLPLHCYGASVSPPLLVPTETLKLFFDNVNQGSSRLCWVLLP